MATHSSIAWRIHGQRSPVGYRPWGRKDSDTTEGLNIHAYKHETGLQNFEESSVTGDSLQWWAVLLIGLEKLSSTLLCVF